jgi:uncharacterized lipoprotein (TIGR02269 family)
MSRALAHHYLLSLFLASLLTACTNSSPALRAGEGAEHDDPSSCDDVYADQCVVLACDGDECGIFGCEDLDLEAFAQAPLGHGAELARFPRPPFRGPGPQRNWRRTGLREDARPRVTVHFRYRHGILPAFPWLEGKLVKHHLFPQAQQFRAWFTERGINIHEWTMLLPAEVHLRIHRGADGGPWNAAWRQFYEANQHRVVPREELFRKAFELAFRFDIVGPIMPYYSPVLPPGPQLLAP